MGCHSVCENQGVKSVYRSEQKESKGAKVPGEVGGNRGHSTLQPRARAHLPSPSLRADRRREVESPTQGFSEEGWPPRGALWLLRGGLVSHCSQGQRLRGWAERPVLDRVQLKCTESRAALSPHCLTFTSARYPRSPLLPQSRAAYLLKG